MADLNNVGTSFHMGGDKILKKMCYVITDGPPSSKNQLWQRKLGFKWYKSFLVRCEGDQVEQVSLGQPQVISSSPYHCKSS